jgi:hypothetical protein
MRLYILGLPLLLLSLFSLTTCQNDLLYSIESAQFPNRYLRMATNVINLQFGQGSNTVWIFMRNDDGTYCIQNNNLKGQYLSINGNSCKKSDPNGCGTVYGGKSCGADQKFNLVKINSSYGINSSKYPNVYLRADGSAITSSMPNGGGTINCQYYASGIKPAQYELFKISLLA